MRIKRGADLGCFLRKLSLTLFRKHVIVLDRTEFRCDRSSDLYGLGNHEDLQLFSDYCVLTVKSKYFFCKLEAHFANMTQIDIQYTNYICHVVWFPQNYVYMCLKFDIPPGCWACCHVHKVRWKRLVTLIKNNRATYFFTMLNEVYLFFWRGIFSFEFERGMKYMTYMFSELF